jgi:hypothetical protein
LARRFFLCVSFHPFHTLVRIRGSVHNPPSKSSNM